jgi:hypothetical protein
LCSPGSSLWCVGAGETLHSLQLLSWRVDLGAVPCGCVRQPAPMKHVRKAPQYLPWPCCITGAARVPSALLRRSRCFPLEQPPALPFLKHPQAHSSPTTWATKRRTQRCCAATSWAACRCRCPTRSALPPLPAQSMAGRPEQGGWAVDQAPPPRRSPWISPSGGRCNGLLAARCACLPARRLDLHTFLPGWQHALATSHYDHLDHASLDAKQLHWLRNQRLFA